jgi:RHS repeat-associated protein
MPMPGRKSGSQPYRFSFQGQEKDDEIKGQGNSLNYEYRMHDPRIGRFFAVDPLAAKYPYNSTYAFSENRVIDGVELEGLEWEATNDNEGNIIDYRWIGYRKNENGTLYAQEGTVPGGVIGNTTYSSSGGGPEDLANPIYDFVYGTGYISTSTTRTNENGATYNVNELIKISGDGIEYSKSSTNPEFSFDDQNYSRTYDLDLIRGYKSKSNIESEISIINKEEDHSKFVFPAPGTVAPAEFEFYSTIAFGISGLKAVKSFGSFSYNAFKTGGSTFSQYKNLRGGTYTIDWIQTSTGSQRISIEYHHVFISQSTQKAYGLPNWLVNNRVNVWKLNTIQHSLLDSYRYNFLRKGIKSDVGWFEKYNWFTY